MHALNAALDDATIMAAPAAPMPMQVLTTANASNASLLGGTP